MSSQTVKRCVINILSRHWSENFLENKAKRLTGVSLRYTVMRAGGILYITFTDVNQIVQGCLTCTHRRCGSSKWQWPWGWVDRGDFCPLANEHLTSGTFNNIDWSNELFCWMAQKQRYYSLVDFLGSIQGAMLCAENVIQMSARH